MCFRIFEKIKKHVYGELDEHFTNTRHKLLFNLGNSEILSIKNQYYIDLTDEILFHNPDHGSINVFRYDIQYFIYLTIITKYGFIF